VLILPADLPLLTKDDVLALIDSATKPPVVVIAPDRHKKGTNALLMVPPGLIDYEFGEDSFQKHSQLAKQVKARLEVVELPSLGLDVDMPEDLEMVRKLEATKA
jgi:2-phospho-L-lactate/phosphoenolpyruvate guanylyltransferase